MTTDASRLDSVGGRQGYGDGDGCSDGMMVPAMTLATMVAVTVATVIAVGSFNDDCSGK